MNSASVFRCLNQRFYSLILSRAWICQSSVVRGAAMVESAEETAPVLFEKIVKKEYTGTEVKRIQNKSRLRPHHYNQIHGKPPYPEPVAHYHVTLRYRRRLYGRYGAASGVDPAICFPTKEEIAEREEYERVSLPDSIAVMRERALKALEVKKAARMAREAEYTERLKHLSKWKAEVQAKIDAKLNEAREAKMKREKMLEEVRRHFGYAIDPKEEKFQMMVEQKEKEQQMQRKLERKRKKEQAFMEKLASLEVSAKDAAIPESQKSSKQDIE